MHLLYNSLTHIFDILFRSLTNELHKFSTVQNLLNRYIELFSICSYTSGYKISYPELLR